MRPKYLIPTLFMMMFAALFIVLMPVLSDQLAQRKPLPLRSLDQLRTGNWSMLSPGGDTRCGRDTDYQFYVRPAADGNTDKLMIYFQGGGACWNSLTCKKDGGTFDDFVSSPPVEIGGYDGIFNFENAENPVSDYNFVFVPYCTADVHVGDATVDYGNGLVIQHNGFKNTSAVLDWTYNNFTAPEKIVITGSSAGAYGAIYYMPYVAQQYPDASIVQFGDAGVGATPKGWSVLEKWGMYKNMPAFVPDLAAVDQTEFTLNVLYQSDAAFYPNATFAQYTTAADDVQTYFYGFSAFGDLFAPSWDKIMNQNLDELDAAHANFASMVVGGKSHTILARPEFYTYGVGDTRVRDWFAGLVAGEKVENLRCTDCAEAEIVTK